MINLKFLKTSKFLKTDFIFIIIFVIFATFYYDSVLTKGPLNTHMWKQTDCLSLTRGYSEGAPFFKPEMNLQIGDNYKSGTTAGEFPILYYIAGMIWKFFGESYFSFRFFYLLILFTGVFAFYKSLGLLFKDTFWAVAISMLLYTSPTYVVYGVSFLPDAPAFSFILIALYFFLRYSREKKQILFIVSMAFFALAGLIKVPSLIAFVFLFFIRALESFSYKSLGDKKVFKCNIYEWTGFVSVILIVFSWYYYAYHYNTLHGFRSTLNNIFPIWDIKENSSEELIRGIKNFTSLVFFSRSVILAFSLLGIMNLFLWKRIPIFAYLSNIMIILGCITYIILWAPLMGAHDYYYIALLILFPGILLPFIWFIKTNHYDIFKSILLKIFIIVFLLFNFIYCLSVVKLKTLAQKGNYIMVGNHEFVGVMRWTNWDVSSNWKRFETMKPYIRQIGIKKEDRVISLPDQSPNVSLYLMGQKGWTDYFNYKKSEDIENLIDKGAKYLFISDPVLLTKEFLSPFITDSAGSFEGIRIFKLSKTQGR